MLFRIVLGDAEDPGAGAFEFRRQRGEILRSLVQPDVSSFG
jgi:hypothetical protein